MLNWSMYFSQFLFITNTRYILDLFDVSKIAYLHYNVQPTICTTVSKKTTLSHIFWWFLLTKGYQCGQNICVTVNLLESLGLTIHTEKSVFDPIKYNELLGFVINSDDTITLMNEVKAQAILLKSRHFQKIIKALIGYHRNENLKKWKTYCLERNYDPFITRVDIILQFLHGIYING